MQRSQVYQVVTGAISKVQSASGNTSQVNGSTCPMGGLSGFDSMNAVEVACDISVGVGCEVPDMKLFFNSARNPRTVNEIVDAVCELVEQSESA